MDLTDAQWEAIRRYIPEPEQVRTSAKGGRPWRDPRDVLHGILWVLRTGAPWADLPRRYPPYQRFVRPLPNKLIGDTAYDSDPLDRELASMGVEMISPHHPRRRKKTQGGRNLRRYRRRWHIERLFAWLMRSRRLVTRSECRSQNFLGFVQLACIQILVRRLSDAF